MRTATAPKVLQLFREAAARWGFPAALLTDNGCVFTTWHRGGPNVMQTELLSLGIGYRHSRPYHPQTCGKVERFHQTMKRFLAAQPPAASIAELQAQVDRFVRYYNEVRPHRGIGRRTPKAAWEARDRARPSVRRSWSARVSGCGGTASIRWAGSRFGIAAASTTSGWAGSTRVPGSSCSSTGSTFGSSRRRESSSAT